MTLGLLKESGTLGVIEWIALRLRLASLARYAEHHDHWAQCAANQGDYRAQLDHLEYQAHYLTERIRLHPGSFIETADEREELFWLIDKIQKMAPRTDPSAACFNAKLARLKATYGRFTCPPDPPHGLGAN